MTAKEVLIGGALLLAASGALAQSRAPLAGIDELEPAVDTRESRAQAPPAEASPAARDAAAAAPREPAPAVTQPGGSAAAGATASSRARAASELRSAPTELRVAAAGGSSRVIDSLDLGTTSITGNQELPKVLYIVPWKRSDLGDLVGRPVNTLLDEVLTPVDPEVFERSLTYYEALYGGSEEE